MSIEDSFKVTVKAENIEEIRNIKKYVKLPKNISHANLLHTKAEIVWCNQ